MLFQRSIMPLVIAAAVCAAITQPAQAQLDKILQGIGIGKGSISDSKAASGIKEALQVGTDRAVDLTGTTDGFLKNQAIRILMPEKIRTLEKGLRLAGMGPKIDEFEVSTNRAAEKAAPAARGIFKDALLQMTFTDARRILTGPDTAATDYFKQKTSDKLTAAFRPAVESAMAENGVVKQYQRLTGGLAALPTLGRTTNNTFDITTYVVSKAMDGLFYMLGQEEKKIRTNPAARITPLLREVFGKRNPN